MTLFPSIRLRIAGDVRFSERADSCPKRHSGSIGCFVAAVIFALPQVLHFGNIITGAYVPQFAGLCAAEKNAHGGGVVLETKYLGKDYIDSTVLHAIYIINDAACVAGVGFRERESLQEARLVAQRLKTSAKGDPNERYALWKINELEWLINLEEKDLELQKMKDGQATVNQIIVGYNAELGKPRPDFKQLLRLHAQMAEIDAAKGNAMVESINKRSKVISREVVVSLERALINANGTKATEEFRYCLRNRSYLVLSNAKFEQLEAQVSASSRARDELPLVEGEIDKAQKLLDKNMLGQARTAVAAANYRYSDIRNFVPEQEAGPVNLLFSRLDRTLALKEDSLVRINMEILKTKGVGEADDYLNRVVRQVGVSREKAGFIDQAILAVASPEEKSRTVKEIDDVTAGADESGQTDVMGEMRRKAAKKAQQKLDSIKAVEETKARGEQAYPEKQRLDQDRIEKERQVQATLEKERQEQARRELKELARQEQARQEQVRRDSIDAVVRGSAAKGLQKNQEFAQQIAENIYLLLDKNKSKVAGELFAMRKAVLQQYLMPEAFAMLEATIRQAMELHWETQSEVIGFLIPNEAQQPAASKLAANVAVKENENNKEKAQEIVIKVYELLEHNDAKGAYERLDRDRTFLKTYLDNDAYEMLNSSIIQAHNATR